TGFRLFQESEVNYRREALEELANAPAQVLEESFPLLSEGAPEATADSPEAPAADSAGETLDTHGGGQD
ncbi:MAG: hypothetical protein AAF989_12465, partial [Planctomycetota bacterium]